jgi:hypothetical protein
MGMSAKSKKGEVKSTRSPQAPAKFSSGPDTAQPARAALNSIGKLTRGAAETRATTAQTTPGFNNIARQRALRPLKVTM